MSSRSRDTSRESSSVRPGASPFQNGIDGAAPCASSTRTRPVLHARMRQEVVPSRKTSPARLSTAKSSSSVPTVVPSGSATTMILRGFRNRAAGGDGRQPRAAPPAHALIHLIAMQIRAAAPARGGDAFGKHLQHRVEIAALQRAVRLGAAHQIEQLVFAEIFA